MAPKPTNLGVCGWSGYEGSPDFTFVTFDRRLSDTRGLRRAVRTGVQHHHVSLSRSDWAAARPRPSLLPDENDLPYCLVWLLRSALYSARASLLIRQDWFSHAPRNGSSVGQRRINNGIADVANSRRMW